MKTRKVNMNFSENLFMSLQLLKGDETITEFIENAVMDRCERIVTERRGGKVLYIENPQINIESSIENEKAIMELRAVSKEAEKIQGADLKLDDITRFVIQRVFVDDKYEKERYMEEMKEESPTSFVLKALGEYRKGFRRKWFR